MYLMGLGEKRTKRISPTFPPSRTRGNELEKGT
jgi:hypothetical protein